MVEWLCLSTRDEGRIVSFCSGLGWWREAWRVKKLSWDSEKTWLRFDVDDDGDCVGNKRLAKR